MEGRMTLMGPDFGASLGGLKDTLSSRLKQGL